MYREVRHLITVQWSAHDRRKSRRGRKDLGRQNVKGIRKCSINNVMYEKSSHNIKNVLYGVGEDF